MSNYPIHPELIPDLDMVSGPYRASFAGSEQELDEVLLLRFEVFNLELGEGLEENTLTRRDLDPYDAQCHHLMVRNTETNELVGTYRMQTGIMADAGLGFYSADEFNFDALPDTIKDGAVELGRACIARDHRSSRVLFLLWRGMLTYLRANRKRYLFGCCSLTSQNPEEGHALFHWLKNEGMLWDKLSLPATPRFECPAPAKHPDELPGVKPPKLLRMYLDYGARICSQPALDRAFKTIDYLALFDFDAHLSPKVAKLFPDVMGR